MATTITSVILGTPARNDLVDALNAAINAGTGAILELYEGGTGGTLLAEVVLDATSAFGAGAGGVITLDVSPVPTDPTAAATGTPDAYRLMTQTGGTEVFTGAITSGDTINAGQPVNVTAWTINMPAS